MSTWEKVGRGRYWHRAVYANGKAQAEVWVKCAPPHFWEVDDCITTDCEMGTARSVVAAQTEAMRAARELLRQ